MRVKINTMTTQDKGSTRDLYYSSPARGEERKVNLSTTIVSCAVTLAIGLIIGINFESLSNQANRALTGKADSSIDFSSLNEVYETLVDNYDGKVDKSKVIEEAKRGLVNAVNDPYTYYMTASEYRDFTSDLNGDVGAGIGVEIGLRENFVKVLRTTKDNPARKAGVLAGDIIYKVDGEDVTSLDTEGVAKKLRGAAGSEVKLTVVRNNEEKEFTLVRETINNESVYVEYRDKTAIMTISRFDEKTGELAENLAREIKDKGCDKLILDLRGNGGGYVFDCRSVNNPGRYEQYRHLCGLDPEVQAFLEDDGGINRFLDSVFKLVDAHIDCYLKRGFTHLQLCFGCTGGQHRSVFSALRTAEHLKSLFGASLRVHLSHRELGIDIEDFKH